MSTVAPTPEPASIPAPPEAAPVASATGPSKLHVGERAFVAAITSKAAMKLEFALVRYVVYAVAAALGYGHLHALGF